MILRRLSRLLLVAALLLAQQSAFAHQIWHFASANAQFAQGAGAGGAPLCDQHGALGDVLGAIGCAAASVPRVAPEFRAAVAAIPPVRSNAPLAAFSRGPPALL
jgi:hypothetical protein